MKQPAIHHMHDPCCSQMLPQNVTFGSSNAMAQIDNKPYDR